MRTQVSTTVRIDKLPAADFGQAAIGIRDDRFPAHLAKALPKDVPFNPTS